MKSYALNLASTLACRSTQGKDTIDFGEGDFTVECWVKTSTFGTLISNQSSDGSPKGTEFVFGITSEGRIQLATTHGTEFYEINTDHTSICDGEWHFISGLRRSNTWMIYLDGKRLATTLHHETLSTASADRPLALGLAAIVQRSASDNQWTGQLGEVRIWNVARSPLEIQTQKKQALTEVESSLIGYYPFSKKEGKELGPLVAAVASTCSSPDFLSASPSLIDGVQTQVKGYFNHLSGTNYIRILDTPRVWGMPFGKEIMPQARSAQKEYERALVEVMQKAKYRCDLSSLNCPDPDWVRVILGAMDTALTKKMGRTRPTQFRFLFGQTPMVPVGEPYPYGDFKAALIRLVRIRSKHWEVMPEIWLGRFYRFRAGIISVLQAKVFGAAVIGADDTKMTWNHTKIVSVDGSEALMGGHNLNMDLFRSYPPVHDVSVVAHGEAAYGAQLFLNEMWACSTDLLTKESLEIRSLSWVNRDREKHKPEDPLSDPMAAKEMKRSQEELIALHQRGVQKGTDGPPTSCELSPQGTTKEQDLQTLEDLNLDVFQERISYDDYDKFNCYKQAARVLTVGKYWNGPEAGDFQNASELMKKYLIKNAKRTIRMSQMDIVSAWKKNWSDHVICQWILEALVANPDLQVQIVVSPLDAGAGAEGDQYSFGSGAQRTFELLKYYMTHDAATDEELDDHEGTRANALKRLAVAPFYFTDRVPADKTIEGLSYHWPKLTKEGYTASLKQPSLTIKPPKKGVIGSAAMSVVNASGYLYDKVASAPGNHAKIMIIDDEAYIVGSDNLYPGFLSEINYLIEGRDAVKELMDSYWNPLWKYSGPHCISG